MKMNDEDIVNVVMMWLGFLIIIGGACVIGMIVAIVEWLMKL
jgi:ABC-type bacteriocin/lantibiotic exporter with double-glycine peptidase domain